MKIANLYIKPAVKTDDAGLIPLINIVFLLLIFFMVTGQMDWLANLKIEMPASTGGKPADKSNMTIAQDADAHIYLDGTPVTITILKKTLSESQLSESRVNLSLDKHLTAKELDLLLGLLRDHSVKKVNLYTEVHKQ